MASLIKFQPSFCGKERVATPIEAAYRLTLFALCLIARDACLALLEVLEEKVCVASIINLILLLILPLLTSGEVWLPRNRVRV